MKVRNRFWRVRDDDDWDIPSACCDLLTNREAIDVGQDDVQDDRINREELFEDGHGFEPVSRLSRRESRHSQRQAQQSSKIVVFFNDQDGLIADGHGWTAISSRTALPGPVACVSQPRQSTVPRDEGGFKAALDGGPRGISASHERTVERMH